MSVLTLLALAGTPEAEACGGFACAQSRPVLQAAERIVFGIDEHEAEVEMHVQITYEGPADQFAWIVPVPAEPDLFLTTGALFTRVATATQPRFILTTVEEGRCAEGLEFGVSREFALSNDSGAAAPQAASTGVTVVGEEAIGPYETVTLLADDTEALLGWLDQHGYDLPPAVDGALSPYVSHGAYFVALRLQKNKDAGDLAPLGLRYGLTKKGMVPVQLTSVSATPDMRMEAYVFSNTRAVPESYLHVQINDAAIDWWSAGSNYAEVITQAADEAGGHAFATDYYGESDIVRPIWNEALYDEASLRSAPNAGAWMDRLRLACGAPPPELYTLVEDLFGVPSGQGAVFYSCPTCVNLYEFDAEVATDALIPMVVEPMRTAQALLDAHPKLTRLTSSLDAVEMTVDPIFVLNHDMTGEVPRARRADFVYECGNGRARDKANRRLDLADGRQIDIPSEADLPSGQTPFGFIADLGVTKAQVIEATGAEGLPAVLTDHTDAFFEMTRLHNKGLGFGCDSAGLGGVGLLGGVAALLASRRRKLRG